ncbi:hypothetical protein OOU_Y34scaffold00671g1 [Pyricularia oryzae Y34]|uniref:Uncharacterized protein n=1 Tax=Pyricularia oryzae (strain Y34) TaxID=1143189 RepID=A0AA97NTM2_PYRO3|nr:hypothetical protein OOU_Y34scaffold00671g1 [Pyricularia oryzae Y34]
MSHRCFLTFNRLLDWLKGPVGEVTLGPKFRKPGPGCAAWTGADSGGQRRPTAAARARVCCMDGRGWRRPRAAHSGGQGSYSGNFCVNVPPPTFKGLYLIILFAYSHVNN